MDNRVKGKWRRFLKISIVVILTIVVLRVALLLIPYPKLSEFINRQNSTRFYDRNGTLLQIMPLENGMRREYYPLNQIPKQLQQTFIDAEDKNFYLHPGVDVFSILRAASQNNKSGKVVSGASTITMQLVRMIYPRKKNEPVTLRTKFVEALIALRIESKISKNKILELYLNNVPFGYQIEGVGSASRSFYGIEVNELSSQQMRTLSEVPRRPAEYAPPKMFTYPNLCPHFVQYVTSQYRSESNAKGKASGTKWMPDSLKLSVDNSLCVDTETAIQLKLDEYKDARIHNGSAFVISNRTGEIMVWVGNGNFYDEHGGQIDGVLVRNQPGSSMKPFLYALALEGTVPAKDEKQYSFENRTPLDTSFVPTSVLPDIPQDFGSSMVYVPLNFNNRYNGPVRMRVALASSLNIPAVYVLNSIGVSNYMRQLSVLGFRSLDGQRDTTGLSLALGSGEVTLYEMVNAFSVFPRDGVSSQITYQYRGQLPVDGDVSRNQSSVNQTMRVYSADTARIICNMLSDKAARALGFGHAKVFDTPYPCIFKTGTSNQYQNIIALGATSEFTVGVWLGNFEGETVIRQTGSSIPATIVRQLLDTLTAKYGACAFAEPESYVKKDVCTLSGMEPTQNCPSVVKEYVSKRNADRKYCTWHCLTEDSRVQINYPSEYQHWMSNKNMAGKFSQDSSQLELVYPKDGAVFIYDPTIPLAAQKLHVQAAGGNSSRAELYVDSEYIGEAVSRFYWDVPLSPGGHKLTVVCGDEEKVVTYFVK